MTTRRSLLAFACCLPAAQAFAVGRSPVVMGEAQWRGRLTPAQFDILRDAGTEAPYSSPLDTQFAPGRYDCVGCGQKLYSSRTKFDSHTGWPSFYAPLPEAVVQHADSSLGMERTEVRCAGCGGHLGHVFDDGPRPTGLRYCMNGAVLNFVPGVAA